MRRHLLLAGLVSLALMGPGCSSDKASSEGDPGGWTSVERSADDWDEDSDGSSAPAEPGDADNAGGSGNSDESFDDCFNVDCPAGFYCEFGVCVAEGAAGTAVAAITADRYLYSLEVEKRRIVRIDAQEFQVDALETGLAPMDMQVLPSGERLVLVDASDTVEVVDGSGIEENRVIWDTARSLSHLKISPTGEHLALYYDWDDPRALDRQSDPGNINQISILAVGDSEFVEDDDDHLVDLSVGLLPRDVQFSADGDRAVVIGRRDVTRVDLLTVEAGVAAPTNTVDIDESAVEFLVNQAATQILLRFDSHFQLHVVDLDDGSVTCLGFAGNITDVLSTGDDNFLVAFNTDAGHQLSTVSFSDAGPTCPADDGDFDIGDADSLTYDASSARVLAYVSDASVENLWFLDLVSGDTETIRLEKAVAAVAFASGGDFVRVSHLKAAGVPAWNPAVEDTDVSIDKSYGVSWIDLNSGLQRLTIRDEPFGPFSFAPHTLSRTGATYQALVEDNQPRMLVVEHSAGFNESWIDFASETLYMGYILATDSIYSIQDHPMGRVTFVDAQTHDLRHVTGYALDLE